MILEIIHTVVVFLLAMTFLIVFHELGHFLVARWCGVPVLRFSVGLGPVLYSRMAGGTEFALSALPLGGYVAMLDENDPEAAARVTPELRQHAFNRQPVARRSLIAAAGPAFNFAFAVLAFTVVYLIGIPGLKPSVETVESGSLAAQAGLRPGMTIVAVAGREVHTWEMVFNRLLGHVAAGAETVSVRLAAGTVVQLSLRGVDLDALSEHSLLQLLGLGILPPAHIVGVQADSPAARAGLQVGDQVIEAAGQPVRTWRGLGQAVVAAGNTALPLQVLRDGSVLQFAPVPILRPDASGVQRGWLGVQGKSLVTARESYPLHLALWRGVVRCVEVVRLTFNVLLSVVIGEASVQNFSGPIGIAHLSGQVAELGPLVFLQFLGLISLGLAVFNLLPVPLLDGGHLMYDLIELIKGSPVSLRFRRLATQAGLALLLFLFILICYNDVMRLFQ